MKSSSSMRSEIVADMYQRAERSFADHRLLYSSPGKISAYAIGREGSSVFYAEVCVGYAVTVQGDVDIMSFRGGPIDHIAKLHWCANSCGDYLREKAGIGMSGSELLIEYDADIARREILEYRRQRSISHEQAASALAAIRRNEPQSLVEQAFMEDDESDSWELLPLGNVPSWRVINAHVAVKTLVRLLEGTNNA